MSSASPNYAEEAGIHSISAAFTFAGTYLVLSGWFFIQRRKHPSRSYISMMILSLIGFCITCLVAFILRGILAASKSAGENSTIVTVYETISGLGFFGLLFSVCILVVFRFERVERGQPSQGIFAALRNVRLLGIAMVVSALVGIIGNVEANKGREHDDSTRVSLGNTLHEISLVIGLILTLLQAIQALILSKKELEAPELRQSGPLGVRYGPLILLAISVCLIVHQAFTVATMTNTIKQDEEDLWYPLAALPEVLAVILFAAPGLVPSSRPKNELPGIPSCPIYQ